MPDTYQEGQTATSKDGKKRVVFRNGMWLNDTSYKPPAEGPAKTSAQDRQELNAASSKAAAERDALRTYSKAKDAVETMGTGPGWASYLDAITPEEGGGVLDSVGGFLGTPLRALVSQDTWDARDHLKTVNANVALAGSQQMKGSSSDKDTALMRLSGIGPSKTEGENLRIIQDATYTSGLEQARALIKADWIGKFGSLANPSPNGMTSEQALQMGEQRYDEYYYRRRKTPAKTAQPTKKALPKPPPKKSSGSGRLTIDINGNPL